MCQWLMTAALSELLNQVRVTFNCTESKVWLYVRLFVGTLLASPLFPCLRNVLGIKCNLCQRLWPLLSQSIPSPWVWLLVHVRICVFVNTFVSLFSIEGYFCGCANSGQIWAAEFDTKCSYFLFVWFFFCRNRFCCKMHMQKFCTEVTILPAAAEPSPAFLAWKKFSIEIWSL